MGLIEDEAQSSSARLLSMMQRLTTGRSSSLRAPVANRQIVLLTRFLADHHCYCADLLCRERPQRDAPRAIHVPRGYRCVFKKRQPTGARRHTVFGQTPGWRDVSYPLGPAAAFRIMTARSAN